jgi:hypothetical protein
MQIMELKISRKTASCNNHSIQFSIYLHAELNSQWAMKESSRKHTTATESTRTNETKK